MLMYVLLGLVASLVSGGSVLYYLCYALVVT